MGGESQVRRKSKEIVNPTPHAFYRLKEGDCGLRECRHEFLEAPPLHSPTNGDRPGVVDLVVNEGGLPFIYGRG